MALKGIPVTIANLNFLILWSSKVFFFQFIKVISMFSDIVYGYLLCPSTVSALPGVPGKANTFVLFLILIAVDYCLNINGN